MNSSLDGRTALVTGAGRGIALGLAQSGAGPASGEIWDVNDAVPA